MRKIVFLVSPTANVYDFAGTAQVFQEAQALGVPLEMIFCSYETMIEASTGLPIGPLPRFDSINLAESDYVIIPSIRMHDVLNGDLRLPNSVIAWLHDAHRHGATLCSLCTGVFVLGQTGLLDNRTITTHWKYTQTLQRLYPGSNVSEHVIYVEDGNIITSAGATSGADVALYIVTKISDDYTAFKISRELVIYARRNGSTAQHSELTSYRNHVHAGVHRVQDWLVDNLFVRCNIPDLAEIALMSERNFTRVFKRETNLTVNEYITKLRKERIAQLLHNPDISRNQIAYMCGLTSVRQLNRLMNGK